MTARNAIAVRAAIAVVSRTDSEKLRGRLTVGRGRICDANRQRHSPKRVRRRIRSMDSSTTDKVKGTAREVAGKVKEETGKAVGNPDLQDRGTTEKTAGKVERKVGDVKKVFGQ